MGAMPWRDVFGLGGAGALVAAVGFADDHVHLRRRWRLLAHFAAAAAIVASVGSLPRLIVLEAPVDLGWAGLLVALLYVVWLVNLTNFMDGIDGIAASEAITVSLGGALLYVVSASPAAAWSAPLLLAAASLGFLRWNWPPARIFMGDVGSGFLGLMLAALSLRAGAAAPELLWAWLILLGVFIVDATMTLGRRSLRGERIYEAHRTHAYQRAALRVGNHRPVTFAVASINVVWLLPIALLVASGIVDGTIGLAVAYTPLVLAAWQLGAGAPTPGRPVSEAIV
jgi:Fuc2NAc and GlcNAc transferase